MKESTREALKDIFQESREDRARRRPSRILFLVALLLAGASLLTGDHLLQMNIGLASITAAVASTYLLAAPKGAARVIALVSGSVAILGMAASNAVIMSGGVVPAGSNRILSYLLLASMLTQIVYTVKTKLIDTRADGQTAAPE